MPTFIANRLRSALPLLNKSLGSDTFSSALNRVSSAVPEPIKESHMPSLNHFDIRAFDPRIEITKTRQASLTELDDTVTALSGECDHHMGRPSCGSIGARIGDISSLGMKLKDGLMTRFQSQQGGLSQETKVAEYQDHFEGWSRRHDSLGSHVEFYGGVRVQWPRDLEEVMTLAQLVGEEKVILLASKVVGLPQ